jgi:PRD1 phage membrane DNA delivery
MKFGDSIITILTAIVGLAVIAVLVSKQAQTGSVLTAGGNAFSSVIKAAVAPVSGSGILGS